MAGQISPELMARVQLLQNQALANAYGGQYGSPFSGGSGTYTPLNVSGYDTMIDTQPKDPFIFKALTGIVDPFVRLGAVGAIGGQSVFGDQDKAKLMERQIFGQNANLLQEGLKGAAGVGAWFVPGVGPAGSLTNVLTRGALAGGLGSLSTQNFLEPGGLNLGAIGKGALFGAGTAGLAYGAGKGLQALQARGGLGDVATRAGRLQERALESGASPLESQVSAAGKLGFITPEQATGMLGLSPVDEAAATLATGMAPRSAMASGAKGLDQLDDALTQRVSQMRAAGYPEDVIARLTGGTDQLGRMNAMTNYLQGNASLNDDLAKGLGFTTTPAERVDMARQMLQRYGNQMPTSGRMGLQDIVDQAYGGRMTSDLVSGMDATMDQKFPGWRQQQPGGFGKYGQATTPGATATAPGATYGDQRASITKPVSLGGQADDLRVRGQIQGITQNPYSPEPEFLGYQLKFGDQTYAPSYDRAGMPSSYYKTPDEAMAAAIQYRDMIGMTSSDEALATLRGAGVAPGTTLGQGPTPTQIHSSDIFNAESPLRSKMADSMKVFELNDRLKQITGGKTFTPDQVRSVAAEVGMQSNDVNILMDYVANKQADIAARTMAAPQITSGLNDWAAKVRAGDYQGAMKVADSMYNSPTIMNGQSMGPDVDEAMRKMFNWNELAAYGDKVNTPQAQRAAQEALDSISKSPTLTGGVSATGTAPGATYGMGGAAQGRNTKIADMYDELAAAVESGDQTYAGNVTQRLDDELRTIAKADPQKAAELAMWDREMAEASRLNDWSYYDYAREEAQRVIGKTYWEPDALRSEAARWRGQVGATGTAPGATFGQGVDPRYVTSGLTAFDQQGIPYNQRTYYVPLDEARAAEYARTGVIPRDTTNVGGEFSITDDIDFAKNYSGPKGKILQVNVKPDTGFTTADIYVDPSDVNSVANNVDQIVDSGEAEFLVFDPDAIDVVGGGGVSATGTAPGATFGVGPQDFGKIMEEESFISYLNQRGVPQSDIQDMTDQFLKMRSTRPMTSRPTGLSSVEEVKWAVNQAGLDESLLDDYLAGTGLPSATGTAPGQTLAQEGMGYAPPGAESFSMAQQQAMATPEALRQPGTAELGLTVFRPDDLDAWKAAGMPMETMDDVMKWHGTAKAQDFDRYLREQAKVYGVDVVSVDKTGGVWEGSLEPSWSIKVKPGAPEEAYDAFMANLGDLGDQDAVVRFLPGSGPDMKYIFSGSADDLQKIHSVMKARGITAGTVEGSNLVLYDFDNELKDAIIQLSDDLGVSPESFGGQAKLMFKKDYGAAVNAYRRITGRGIVEPAAAGGIPGMGRGGAEAYLGEAPATAAGVSGSTAQAGGGVYGAAAAAPEVAVSRRQFQNVLKEIFPASGKDLTMLTDDLFGQDPTRILTKQDVSKIFSDQGLPQNVANDIADEFSTRLGLEWSGGGTTPMQPIGAPPMIEPPDIGRTGTDSLYNRLEGLVKTGDITPSQYYDLVDNLTPGKSGLAAIRERMSPTGTWVSTDVGQDQFMTALNKTKGLSKEARTVISGEVEDLFTGPKADLTAGTGGVIRGGAAPAGPTRATPQMAQGAIQQGPLAGQIETYTPNQVRDVLGTRWGVNVTNDQYAKISQAIENRAVSADELMTIAENAGFSGDQVDKFIVKLQQSKQTPEITGISRGAKTAIEHQYRAIGVEPTLAKGRGLQSQVKFDGDVAAMEWARQKFTPNKTLVTPDLVPEWDRMAGNYRYENVLDLEKSGITYKSGDFVADAQAGLENTSHLTAEQAHQALMKKLAQGYRRGELTANIGDANDFMAGTVDVKPSTAFSLTQELQPDTAKMVGLDRKVRAGRNVKWDVDADAGRHLDRAISNQLSQGNPDIQYATRYYEARYANMDTMQRAANQYGGISQTGGRNALIRRLIEPRAYMGGAAAARKVADVVTGQPSTINYQKGGTYPVPTAQGATPAAAQAAGTVKGAGALNLLPQSVKNVLATNPTIGRLANAATSNIGQGAIGSTAGRIATTPRDMYVLSDKSQAAAQVPPEAGAMPGMVPIGATGVPGATGAAGLPQLGATGTMGGPGGPAMQTGAAPAPTGGLTMLELFQAALQDTGDYGQAMQLTEFLAPYVGVVDLPTAQGGAQLSSAQQTKLSALNQAEQYLNTVYQRYSELGGSSGLGPLDWAYGSVRGLGGRVGLAPEAKGYEDFKQGVAGPMFRMLGVSGTMSDKDIQRAVGLLPSLTDTPEVAQRNYQDLYNLIQQNKQFILMSPGYDQSALMYENPLAYQGYLTSAY